MELVLGIDLGTSYFKVGLFDRQGQLCGLGRAAVLPETGDGSRYELSIEDFWQTLRKAINQACSQAKADPTDIVALSYACQANSFLLLDAADQPLTPLILWPDHRAESVPESVQQVWSRTDFLTTTGLGIDCSTEFCLVKLCWFQKQMPQLWKRVKRCMTLSDYLVYSLTGEPVGDAGTAALLGMWNVRGADWWDVPLEQFKLHRSQLSQPLMPGTVAGKITQQGNGRLGLKCGIPLAVGSLDHHIAAIGAGVNSIADLSESTGTVLACLRCADEFIPQQKCCVGPAGSGQYYYLSFANNGAGGLRWYQQNYAPQFTIEELIDLASAVAPGADGLRACASAWTYPEKQGFIDVDKMHGHGHFIRALMESTAATLYELTKTLYHQGRPRRIVATGGGARSDLWLQIKADLLDSEFIATQCDEPACLGAALLASISVGWFSNLTQAGQTWVTQRQSFTPQKS